MGLDFIREKIRKRDNWICQKCGKKWVFGERRFDVHHTDHIVEGLQSNHRGRYKIDKENFDKMITLCHKCHLNLPHIIEKISTPQSKLNHIKQLRKSRKTYREIAALYGCSYQNIQVLCKRYSIYK